MYAMLHLQCLLGVTIGLGWADGKALVAYVNLGPTTCSPLDIYVTRLAASFRWLLDD